MTVRTTLTLGAVAALALLAFPGAASARIGEWRHAWEVVQLVRLQAAPGDAHLLPGGLDDPGIHRP